MSELPAGWACATIGDISSYVQRGKGPQYTNESELPVVNQKCIRWSGVDEQHLKFVHPDQWGAWDPVRFLRPGDVLWNSTGTGTIGRAAIFRGSANFSRMVVDSHVTIVRTTEYNSQLLHYWLSSPTIRSRIEKMQNGSTNQVELSKAQVLGTEIPVPPLKEQHRIVTKLDALTEKSRRAKNALDAIPPLLEKFRQSILAAAFRGDLTADWREKNPNTETASQLLERIRIERRQRWETTELAKWEARGESPRDNNWKAKYSEPRPVDTEGLPELPNGWAWASVEQVGTCELGRMRSPDKHSGDNMQPYLRVKNVFEDRIDIGDVMQMQFEPKEFELYLLRRGDVLLNEGQSLGLLGRPAIFRGEMKRVAFTNSLIRFQPFGGITSEYALGLFRHYMRSGHFRKLAQITTNIAHLGVGRLRTLEYPVPPAKEQEQIASLLRTALAMVQALESRMKRNHETLKTLDSGLLAKAFRGQLVPQDPTDEPAAAPPKKDRSAKKRQSAT